MKMTVTEPVFIDHFKSIRPESFTRDALVAMFDYFHELEDSIGEEMELDVIAICCDYAEYDSALEAAREMSSWVSGLDPDDFGDTAEYEDAREAEALEHLTDNTTVITFDGGIVVQSF